MFSIGREFPAFDTNNTAYVIYVSDSKAPTIVAQAQLTGSAATGIYESITSMFGGGSWGKGEEGVDRGEKGLARATPDSNYNFKFFSELSCFFIFLYFLVQFSLHFELFFYLLFHRC
jgi:hypothetical protein